MRLYLGDSSEIHIFELPLKVDGSFLFNFKFKNSNIENLLSIDAYNNTWMLKSNGNINIKGEGSFSSDIILNEYDIIPLTVIGANSTVYLYVMPGSDNNTSLFETKNTKLISLGSNNDCNINSSNKLLVDTTLNIGLQDNAWHIAPNPSEEVLIYLNGKRVRKPEKIVCGDTIFTAGIKIIWMNEFFKINNPNNSVSIKGLNPYAGKSYIDNMKYASVTEEEESLELYSEDDYFFHTPRLRTLFEEETVVIDPPPENQEDTSDLPFLLSMGTSLTMVASSLMTGYNVVYSLSMGTRTWAAAIPSIVICVAMIFGSVLVPRLIRRYQKKSRHKRELHRQDKYTKYVLKKEKEIQFLIKKQSQILTENNVDLGECKNTIMLLNRNIWNREISDNDFLTVRLGMGEYPTKIDIKVPEEHFTLDDDNLRELVYKLPEKYELLNNVPVTVSLLENPLTAFICNATFNQEFINGLMLQLITHHSALDLKIVLLTNENNAKNWSYLKLLPHCFSDDKELRFFCTNSSEIKTIGSYLDKVFKERQEIASNNGKEEEDIKEFDSKSEYKNFQPYYLIITDDYSEIKDLDFVNEYLKRTNNVGFSLMMFEKSMKNLPNECNMFVQIFEKNSGLFNKELTGSNQIKFQADYNPTIDMYEMASRIASIPIQSKEASKALPQSLSFLDVYNIGKIEQLNILNRWQVNNPVNTLQAPVGVHTNGEPFILDLHEKVAGPHGLIAGSTGSGKSEFIITYILSMAINFHPEEVQFVLIDYKGGGLAGAFENRETGVSIPHLAGTITNLDTSEMNRTLVSIESELKRRQEKFNKARDSVGESTMDIYKYQKLYREGVIEEPISHLFIISDEFAELKAQQPDFMAQLISTSRIGRSLGVHLILATQKPSGVVNDQIWSNSRFKVCLKVQTRADSNEMLKRPEAASLKEAGRFYLQIGYDEYFDIGQAGWGGAKYIPTERVIKKIDDSISFIDNTGSVTKSINNIKKKDDNSEGNGDQLTNVVKYLNNLAQKENLVAKKLWLPSLNESIYLGNLRTKYKLKKERNLIKPLIGEFDAPRNQYQGPLEIDFTNNGNTLIYGQTGSGKENLLSTMIFSTVVDHSPEEVNFYIADFGAETLKVFSKYPHVGDVFLLDEENKLNNMIIMLQKELESRKKLFADYAGSFTEYLKNSGKTLPLIIAIINSYETLIETYPRLSDVFTPLFRDASKYGISFIITTSTSGTVRNRISQNFANKICLQMPNDTDYRDLLGSPRGMFPAPKFGRGLVLYNDDVFEFQTANINLKELINQTVRETGDKLLSVYNYKAKKIPILPKIVKVEDVLFEMKGLDIMPIGIEKNTLEVYVYDFTRDAINIIVSSHLANHIFFIYALVRQMLMLENVKVEVIDALGIYKELSGSATLINDNFDEYIIGLNSSLNTPENDKTVHIFIGIAALEEKLNDDNKRIYEDIFAKAGNYSNDIIIFADDYDNIKKTQVNNWYRSNVDNSYGIWLGADVSTQLAINISSLSVEDKKLMFPCIGYPVYKSSHMIIKYVVEGVGDIDEK